MIDPNRILDELKADDIQLRVKRKGKKFKGYQITVFWNIGTKQADHISILVPRDRLDTVDLIDKFMDRRS